MSSPDDDTLYCFALPLAFTLLVGVVSFIFAPTLDDPDTAAQFSPFFSTSAQLIVTLLVALVIERKAIANLNAQARILAVSLVYIAVGAGAAVVALNTRLDAFTYEILFALTMGAGAGALASILAIAYRGFLGEVEDKLDKARPKS